MKTTIKLAAVGILTLILSTGAISGQEQSSSPAAGNRKGISSVLTAQQKEMIRQRREKQKAFRQSFKATISQKQKEILGNPRVMPYERHKEFRASFTDQQVSMILGQREEIKKMRLEFKATLTPEQKAAIKKISQERRMQSHHHFKRSMLTDTGFAV